MYIYIYTRPHELLSFNSYRVKIKVTYLLTDFIPMVAQIEIITSIARTQIN